MRSAATSRRARSSMRPHGMRFALVDAGQGDAHVEVALTGRVNV